MVKMPTSSTIKKKKKKTVDQFTNKVKNMCRNVVDDMMILAEIPIVKIMITQNMPK